MANTKKEEKTVKKVSAKAATKKTATKTTKKVVEKKAKVEKAPKKEVKTVKKDAPKTTPKKVVAKTAPKKVETKVAPVKKEGAKRGRPPKKKINIIEEIQKTLVLKPETVEELKVKANEVEEEPVEDVKKEKKSAAVYTYLGTELPREDTPEDRADRRKVYVREATLFAIIIPVLDLFAMLFIDFYPCYPITNNVPVNYCLTLIIDFVLIFGLAFLIDFIHGELAVKKNNK